MIIIDDTILYQTATVCLLKESYLLIVKAETGSEHFKKIYFYIYVCVCIECMCSPHKVLQEFHFILKVFHNVLHAFHDVSQVF